MLPLSDTNNNNGHRFPFWVFLLIIVNIYIFYLEVTVPNFESFILQYALIPGLIDLSQENTLQTFITNQFLHGGFLHIISNMWFLWIFGDNVERKLGFFIFPLFYLIGGVMGNFLQYLASPDSLIPIIGASGAIASILGAYLAFFPHNKVKTLVFILFFVTIIEIPAAAMLLYWFVIQVISGTDMINSSNFGATGGVAYLAHIGGFAFGWVCGKLLN